MRAGSLVENIETRDRGIDTEDITAAILRKISLPAMLADDFRALREGSGTRLLIIDADRLLNKSGTMQYVIRHAADVDASTTAGLDSARKRAIVIGNVFAPGGSEEPVTFWVSDPRYVNGYFFLTAVDGQGNETTSYLWTVLLEDAVLDTSIPGDVTHPQISESGEVINETNYSVLSVKCQAPVPLGSFDRVQLYMKDYPRFGGMAEGHAERYIGAAGGSIQFIVRYAPAVRRGSQTITVSNGSPTVTTSGANFLGIANALGGDVLEAFGAQGTIQSVSADGNTITLTANWSGPSKVGVSINDYFVIGKIRIHLVSVSKGSTRRPDIENAPYVDVLMDGLMSAPNAPTITGYVIGNGVVIECEQLIGAQAVVYYLWRGEGSGVAFSSCVQIDSTKANLNISLSSGAPLQFRDSDFETIEKETGQYFTYYVTAANARGQQSAASNAISLPCRADTNKDVDPGVGSRVTHKNLLYDACFAGFQNGDVVDTDTAQDTTNGTNATNLPGKPYGGTGAAVGTGRFIGFTRWHSTKDGGAPSFAQFKAGAEVWMSAPGASGNVYLYQEIDAWDVGLGGIPGIKITKNGVYTMSFFAMHDGVVPNGALDFYLEGYNDNTFTGYFPRQYRDANSNLDYYNGGAAPMVIAGSALVATWTRFWVAFKLDSTIGTVKQVRFTFRHYASTSGTVRLTRPMFHEGESPSGWTNEMGDPLTSVTVPFLPPNGIGDGFMRRTADGYQYITP